MCKSCVSALVLLASLALTADAFFLPIFYSRKDPQQSPAVTTNNVGWGRGGQAPQQAYKQEYSAPVYGPAPTMATQIQQMQTSMPHMSQMQPQLQPVPMPMASMQQFTYESPSMVMSYQPQQPQFHNVQLVPCMCPITREVIEQQTQNMMQQAAAAAAAQPVNEGKPMSSQPSKNS